MAAVGFACFGMNLVGIGDDGKPCTPVFTYAANPAPSVSSGPSPPNPSPAAAGGPGRSRGATGPSGCPAEDDVMKRLREALEKTGAGGEGGVEEARRRTGAPTHVSYAPAQLLRWLRATAKTPQRRRVKVWQTLPSLVAARWCCLASAPVSYSEASWMGLLNLRKLDVRERTEAGAFSLFSSADTWVHGPPAPPAG